MEMAFLKFYFLHEKIYNILFVKSIMKTPGIIGGLGPETTARIYLALALSKSSKEYPWGHNF